LWLPILQEKAYDLLDDSYCAMPPSPFADAKHFLITHETQPILWVKVQYADNKPETKNSTVVIPARAGIHALP